MVQQRHQPSLRTRIIQHLRSCFFRNTVKYQGFESQRMLLFYNLNQYGLFSFRFKNTPKITRQSIRFREKTPILYRCTPLHSSKGSFQQITKGAFEYCKATFSVGTLCLLLDNGCIRDAIIVSTRYIVLIVTVRWGLLR